MVTKNFTATQPNIRLHSYRCSSYRGSSDGFDPAALCNCGRAAIGRAITVGLGILVLDTSGRWRTAVVEHAPTNPQMTYRKGDFSFRLTAGPTDPRAPHAAAFAGFGLAWKLWEDDPDADDQNHGHGPIDFKE